MGGEEGGQSLGGKLVSGAAKGTGKIAVGTTKVALKTSAQVAEGLAEGALDATRGGQNGEEEVDEAQGEGLGEEAEEPVDQEDLSSKLVKSAARGTGKLAVESTKVMGKAAGRAGTQAGKAAGKAGVELAGDITTRARKESKVRRAYYGPYCCCYRSYEEDQLRWNKRPARKVDNPLSRNDGSDSNDDDNE